MKWQLGTTPAKLYRVVYANQIYAAFVWMCDAGPFARVESKEMSGTVEVWQGRTLCRRYRNGKRVFSLFD